MHIPDGMLSPATLAATGASSAGFIAYAVAWSRKHLDEQRIVLMAVMAALVFALQMLNFPVAGGTSGHFAGGAAAAIVLGPWAAVIVLTTVLFVQAVMFADGGILALGANVLNIGVLAPFLGYAVWRLIGMLGNGRGVRSAASFAAALVASIGAAVAAAIEIWLSGAAAFVPVVGAMAFWHALIGVGEGLITAGLIAYITSTRPDLLERTASSERSSIRGVAITLGAVALGAVSLSWLASANPDGLEFVYFERGIGAPFEAAEPLRSILAGYSVAGLPNQELGSVIAGLVGLVVSGVMLYLVLLTLRRRRGNQEK